MTVRLGIIGLGQAAQILHLPNLEHMEEMFKVTAVSDISAALTDYIADKYNVKNRFRTAEELIACPEVDAVMVMSSGDHAEYAIKALDAGKHVFIEKPMTLSAESAKWLIEAQERHPDLIAQVGYCRRYNESFYKMKELLRSSDLPITYVHARTVILEGPWYISNTWTEKKATDLDPSGKQVMMANLFASIKSLIGENATRAQIIAFLLITGSGCHILSAVRELIGLPKKIKAATVSPNGMQLALIFEYDGFNMVFEEMNDQKVVEFDESIEIYQGTRKLKLKYDSPYIRSLPSTLTVDELDGDKAKHTVYGPHYQDMFGLEEKEFYRSITESKRPKCDVYDAAEDVKLYLDIAKVLCESTS